MRDTRDLPLAVDLDGTLIRGDVFAMQLTRFLTCAPWRLPELLLWFVNGRANVKAKLAAHAPDAATLPYDERVVAWLTAERARGRVVVLASASDRSAVEAVAKHTGLFDRVIASDGRINMKSRRKADALNAAFPQGFVYAGNESADLRVWDAAAAAVLVNCAPSLERFARSRYQIEREFPR